MPFSDEEVGWIIKCAGLHPSFILRACAVLFDEKLQSAERKVSEQHFKNKAYSALHPLFQDTWERLSEQDKAVIRDEAQQKKYAEQVIQQTTASQEAEPRHQLPELTESAFFRRFVRDVNKISLFKMTVVELEEALERMHDLAALGETNLRLMRGVGRRLNGNVSPTLVERGKVIRGVLQEALELLRGFGARKDTEPSWYSYNILDYRYFSRYRLKGREIAARLEIVDRQYYRKRNDAVADLRSALFEMEELE